MDFAHDFSTGSMAAHVAAMVLDNWLDTKAESGHDADHWSRRPLHPQHAAEIVEAHGGTDLLCDGDAGRDLDVLLTAMFGALGGGGGGDDNDDVLTARSAVETAVIAQATRCLQRMLVWTPTRRAWGAHAPHPMAVVHGAHWDVDENDRPGTAGAVEVPVTDHPEGWTRLWVEIDPHDGVSAEWRNDGFTEADAVGDVAAIDAIAHAAWIVDTEAGERPDLTNC